MLTKKDIILRNPKGNEVVVISNTRNRKYYTAKYHYGKILNKTPITYSEYRELSRIWLRNFVTKI